jgi:UDP-N-acetyl-D-galactosamine dehydrogenase
MLKKSIDIEGACVLVMGYTFKENCPDLRNTRVKNLIHELLDYKLQIDVFDPWLDVMEAEKEPGIEPISNPVHGNYDAVLIAVAHDQFKAMGSAAIRAFGKATSVIYDLKYVLPASDVDLRL